MSKFCSNQVEMSGSIHEDLNAFLLIQGNIKIYYIIMYNFTIKTIKNFNFDMFLPSSGHLQGVGTHFICIKHYRFFFVNKLKFSVYVIECLEWCNRDIQLMDCLMSGCFINVYDTLCSEK